MRILVTGATGMVGRKLCRKLLRKGHDLVVVSRSPEEKFRASFTLPCEYQHWNHLKLNNIQAVFHLAGDPIAGGRWTAKKKKSVLESRTLTTAKLAKALDDQFPEIFIGASAIGYYGDRGSEELIEESPKGKGFLADVCKKWEDSYQPFEERCRLVKVRIGLVFDESGGFLEPMEKLFSFRLGGRVSSGQQWMSWIHSEDLCNMLVFALENKIEGTFNAVAPKPVTNSQWTKAYAKELGVSTFLPVPGLALKLILGEMSQLALASQKVSSAKILDAGFRFQYNDVHAALENLYHWKKQPTEYLFQSEQWIAADKEKVFPFFGEAKNLEKITPPWLNFKILNQSTPEISSGTLINYKISVKGIPMKWRTKIENWNPPKEFVDNQLKGPYKKWHHTHSFEEFPGGTLMKDQVVYQLPMGLLGQLVAGAMVRSDVSSIFSYRTKVIDRMKNKWETSRQEQ